jgi:hypothetical protein
MLAKASKEDSAIMRIIAIETKRDSYTIKTVAILGMFFLHGTFVAVSLTLCYSMSFRAERVMPLLMLTDMTL